MCGRTRVSLAPEQALRAAGTARWVNREAYQPSYNAAPGAATPVVLHGPDGLQLQTMRQVAAREDWVVRNRFRPTVLQPPQAHLSVALAAAAAPSC